MIAANRNHAGVSHRAFLKNDHAGRSRAQVGQADTQFALVRSQHGIGAGQGLEYGVVHVHAGAIDGGDHVLHGARRDRDHVHPHFEPGGHHAQRIVHAGLVIENEFLRQQVQNFAIVGKRDGAGLVHRGTKFLAANFTRPRAETQPAMAVDAAGVRSGHAQQGMLDGRPGRVFRLLDRLLNRTRRLCPDPR